MSSGREAFLNRVRQALAAGNRPGDSADVAPRGEVGYQGAGPDPVGRFRVEFTAAGGTCHIVPDPDAGLARVLDLVAAKSARRVIVSRSPFLERFPLAQRLRAAGIEVTTVETLSPETAREPLFAADVGITGADYLIAETGSVVLLARAAEPRSVSLLPPVHVVLAHRGQILADLFDLFTPERRAGLPSCVTLITGPSKTGDIELRLVTGVHGPGEIHVVLIDRPE